MKFTVVILRRAKVDAQGIYDWIAERSEQGAAQWALVYGEALLALRRNPAQHAIAPESGALGIAIRQSFFKTRRGRPYRLLYQIVGDEVRVLRVPAVLAKRQSRNTIWLDSLDIYNPRRNLAATSGEFS